MTEEEYKQPRSITIFLRGGQQFQFDGSYELQLHTETNAVVGYTFAPVGRYQDYGLYFNPADISGVTSYPTYIKSYESQFLTEEDDDDA